MSKSISFKKVPLIVRLTLIAGLMGSYGAFISIISDFYRADLKAVSSKDALLREDFDAALKLAKEAVELNPEEPYYYRMRAKAYLAKAAATETYEFKKEALADLMRSRELNPLNLATLRNNIPLYYYLALTDFSQPSKQADLDSAYLSFAEAYFQDLKEIYPNDAGLLVSLAHYEKRLDLLGESKSTLEMIKQLRPALLDWHPLLQ
ncbi:hypothetical protein GF360_01305 [candidate division WWE3 bacterium]|nr:hypothetical protein [candidate division WWE3 bacterium]